MNGVTEPTDDILARARRVRILILDCDGVLTDGRIIMLPNGDETKVFDVKDGHAIVMMHRAGIKSGIISGRRSSIVRARANELGIAHVHEMAWVKTGAYEQILAEEAFTNEEVCYIGDDVVDIPLLRRAGFAVAVADAVAEVKQSAHWVTAHAGGRGAVREVIELILRAQGKWEETLSHYING
jgi:3-deoxy-D-manno-octulosonate 8-phosphate phosphatase (KDO 8-P phosphatase)